MVSVRVFRRAIFGGALKFVFGAAFLSFSPISALADCSPDMVARACYSVESHKSDDSRGGVSAAEFCAASAVLECNSPPADDQK
jgi:hypothetical protein